MRPPSRLPRSGFECPAPLFRRAARRPALSPPGCRGGQGRLAADAAPLCGRLPPFLTLKTAPVEHGRHRFNCPSGRPVAGPLGRTPLPAPALAHGSGCCRPHPESASARPSRWGLVRRGRSRPLRGRRRPLTPVHTTVYNCLQLFTGSLRFTKQAGSVITSNCSSHLALCTSQHISQSASPEQSFTGDDPIFTEQLFARLHLALRTSQHISQGHTAK